MILLLESFGSDYLIETVPVFVSGVDFNPVFVMITSLDDDDIDIDIDDSRRLTT